MAFYRLYILFFFLQLYAVSAKAQETYEQENVEVDYVILHDSLRKGRFDEVDFAQLKGWKFSPDNDPEFKSADFNDRDWEEIEGPLSDEDFVPKSWNGFGWLRLKVKVDSTFSITPSFIGVQNSGGLELYINDSLIVKQGNPSPSESREELFGTSEELGTAFTWEKGKIYQIAVKYSFHDYESLKALSFSTSPLDFSVGIADANNLSEILKFLRGLSIVFSSSSILLFLVMILHLFLYIKTKDEKANFWIFLLSLVLFLTTFLTTVAFSGFTDFWRDTILALAMNMGIYFSVGLIPLVAHKVLQVKNHTFWRYFTGYPLIILLLIIAVPDLMMESSGLIIIIICLLTAILGGGIAIQKARKQNKKDIYLIGGPILAFPVIFVLGTLIFAALGYEHNFIELLLMFLLVTIIPLGFSVYQAKRFFRMHSHLDQLVSQRTTDLELAYSNLETSLNDLKAAQNQLVQQEKLASLGQLTAGIAHEIKNPLNFVTNFSDVCIELIEEAKTELKTFKKTGIPSGENQHEPAPLDNIYEIMETVEVNLQKINQHGSRADGIVKSMLLHSRGGSGKIEPTDLNHLVKEYVNLAYHGMRASKNPMDVKIELDLDEKIGKVPLIAEDFSRVILNLCNNAFDAMRDKTADHDFTAVLNVKTYKEQNRVLVSVKDNGPGIKEDILNNILQPFFTTKKGTDGTGLGLSLSNEIIKAHRGEIKISSIPGAGATFIIVLPISNEKSATNFEELDVTNK